ncbi:MAG: 2-isopropylmalate synthase [Balneolales bacterium]
MMKQIKIFDTTLRDGEQAPGFSMNQEEKLRLALQLELLGVDVIEAGFPISSDGDFESVKAIANRITNCSVAGLSRTKKGDIDRAWEALKGAKMPRIHTFIATSDIHMEHKLNKTRKEVLADAVNAVKLAKSYCDDIEFSAEDATRSDPEFLYEIFTAVIAEGATTINVPDTVGYALPLEYGNLIKNIRENVSNIDKATISVHCHNDLGLAVANSIIAVENGAQQIECTINGIGERAGNASLEEIAMIYKTRHTEFDCDTGINTEQIYPVSRLLSEITKNEVQANKAIVGRNAFAHEAGIHQNGVLKNPLTYEIMTPQSVGISSNNIVLGKHSGRRALYERLRALGFNFNKNEMDHVYKEFCRIADDKKEMLDRDLIDLSMKGGADMSSTFTLHKIQKYLNKDSI